MKEILKQDVDVLKLENKTVNVLNKNNINTVLNLCNYSRMELLELGLKNEQINSIIVKLQLKGLDLKKNHAHKNTLIGQIS